MNIIDFDWNSFFVVLLRQSNEDQNTYLKKAQECLIKFYKTYTDLQPPIDIFWDIKGNLESLMEENNFCDMYLKKNCDVKYKVRPNKGRNIPEGIWIYSHKIGSRKPQVEFLREKWKEFEYIN